MIRAVFVADIDNDRDVLATKEAIAMRVEDLGNVKVRQVIVDGKEGKDYGRK